MKRFMDRNFLLSTETAQKLYHQYAAKMPILDYHCHLNPRDIYEDRQFQNMTQIWLGEDHYKWRQMRSNGIEEKYITGDAPDYEKFLKWAETLEKAIGNPLYHWSHLELRRYFNYEGNLNLDTAPEVWEICNQKLKNGLSARQLIEMSNVTLLCTTDDPVDTLEWHQKIKNDKTFQVQVLPTFRPERAMNIGRADYLEYLQELSRVSNVDIKNFESMIDALKIRIDYFAFNGCAVSDHSLDYVMFEPANSQEIEAIFAKRVQGDRLSVKEKKQFETAFMIALGKEYYKRNWVMQLHYGVRRDNNQKIFHKLGPDAGIDCINNYTPSAQTAEFLDALAVLDKLPKTILYSLNPVDNASIGTIIGCFQDSSIAGKIQHGSAWWFNDHKKGMAEHLVSLANLGLLGNFIGMLTDSRSFLSYTRHEYFRRILCELIGGWVENGEYPDDEKALEEIIKGISYNNAVRYFGFDL